MELKNLNTCLNCENLIRDFICQKHNQKVEINTFCESHAHKDTITRHSSCFNCLHFNQKSCSKPSEASKNMICFDWEKKI